MLVVVFAVCSFAHDTWLIPSSFVVARDAILSLDLTSGMMFPALDTSIKPERLERARCRLAGHEFELTEFVSQLTSLRFSSRLNEPGIATFWVDLKPRALQLNTAQVREYLDEIGASPALRKAWSAAKRPRRWRELYTKHSKTFVRVGEPGSDQSWAGPVGMRLEIVPEKDPTALRAGDAFPVRVLKDGSPLQDFSLGLVFEKARHGTIAKTDSAGRVTVHINRKGRYMLRGTDLRKTSQPDIDWESDFTTLTFLVGSQ
jgi:uncharacterized GH25 family protein